MFLGSKLVQRQGLRVFETHRFGIPMMRNTLVPKWRPSNLWFKRYASVKTDTIDWKPMKSNRQINKSAQPKRGKSVVLTLLCLTPIVTLFLGVWQLERLKWKNALVAECEDRLTYKPLPLPKSVLPEDVPNYEYRKVLIKGRFDYDNELFVGPRLHDGERGYLLITPFIRSSDGQKVLVDRGWIHESKMDLKSRKLRHLSVPLGETTVECLLRVAPKKGMFHIDHEPGTRIFRYVDLELMLRETGALPLYAQVVQDFQDHPERVVANELAMESRAHVTSKSSGWKFWKGDDGKTVQDEPAAMVKPKHDFDESIEFDENQFINAGVPLGKIPKVDYKNNHLQYLVTWWGLSFASTVLLFIVFKNRKITNPLDEKLRHARKSM